MKRVVGWAFVVAALGFLVGIWAGIQGYRSASLSGKIEAGLAIAVGCNFLLGLWLWYRAPPGSGDAKAAPGLAMVSASMLVGLLPRVLWPGHEGVHIAGSIASIAASTAVVIVLGIQLRRRRRISA